jgi:exosortase
MTATTQILPATPASKAPDFAECWRRLPHKTGFALLLLAWVALFHFLGNSTFGYTESASLFGWLKYCYSQKAEEEHVFLVPFVIGILAWWKRDELLNSAKGPWWPAVMLLALAVLMHVAGYVVQQARVSFLGFLLGVYALIGATWGPTLLRTIFFPFFLFVFCMPLGSVAEIITGPLRMLVSQLSVAISSHGLGADVVRQGSLIFDANRTIQYDVAPACSGIRSLIALLLISTVYGFVAFKSFWRRWLIVLAAFPLAVAGNTLRITTVIIVGKAWGQEAGARIEQNFGFVTYIFALGTLFALGYWLREDKSPSAPQPRTARDEPLPAEVIT